MSYYRASAYCTYSPVHERENVSTYSYPLDVQWCQLFSYKLICLLLTAPKRTLNTKWEVPFVCKILSRMNYHQLLDPADCTFISRSLYLVFFMGLSMNKWPYSSSAGISFTRSIRDKTRSKWLIYIIAHRHCWGLVFFFLLAMAPKWGLQKRW